MANNIPLSGLSDTAGGFVLPFDQGDVLVQSLLTQSGALSLAGDSRATSTRKEIFAIWQGAPTASFVGEGGTKPVTGGEFGAGTLTIKKIASIVVFTDEMIEDVQAGDLNVLVDSDIRTAINDTADIAATGYDSGTAITGSFDSELDGSTSSVAISAGSGDNVQRAVSAAMGSLEANGFNQSQMGLLLPADAARIVRDARGGTAETALYGGAMADPFYGLDVAYSTNLKTLTAGGGVVGFVVAKPNLHVRVRRDVTLSRSNEATVGGTSLWQNDLTGVRYVTRLGFYVHDINRAVIKLTK